MRNRFLPFMGAVVFAIVATPVMAQDAAIGGVVKDGKGNPVANVNVSIQSLALFQPRVVTTNANGQWRAPLLPPGTYKVVATMTGYNTATRPEIRLGLGDSARLDLVLTPVAQAVVEVTASSNLVDKADAKAGANFSAESLTALPVQSRSFFGAVALTPGMSTAANGSPSVRGSSTQNINYKVDGTDVKSDYQGNLGTWVIEDNVEDVQVALSGLNVRYGRQTGGSVNVVTKSGGNDFHGSLRAKLERPDWRSLTQDPMIQRNYGSDSLDRTYDVTINGPIIKDRLWFSFGTILKPPTAAIRNFAAYTNYGQPVGPGVASSPVMTGVPAMDAVLNAGPGNGYAWTPFSSGQAYHYQIEDKYYEGKITGAITPDHVLELSYQKKEYTIDKRDPYANGNYIIRPEALGSYWWKENRIGLSYRGILSSNLFLEARVGEMKDEFKSPGGDPAIGGGKEGMYIYAGDGVTPGTRFGLGMPFGSGRTESPEGRNNKTANINFKFMPDWAGLHDIDMGVDYYQYYRATSMSSGSRNLVFRAGGAYSNGSSFLFPAVSFVDYWEQGQNDNDGLRGPTPSVLQYFGKDGTYKTIQRGVYLNDTWTLNQNWVVSGGVRLDRNEVMDTDGAKLLSHDDPTYAFMARWDPKGDSSHLWTASVANYAGSFTASFVEQFTKSASSVYAAKVWNASPAGTVRFVNYDELTNLANYGRVLWFSDSSKDVQYNKNMKPPRVQEFSLKYQRSYGDGSRFSINWVERRTLDMWATSVDFAESYLAVIPDPTGATPSGRVVYSRVENNPDLKRAYHGLEVEWNKVFNPTWSMGGSYTYGRSVGNWNDGDGYNTFRENGAEGPTLQRQILNRMGRGEADFAAYGPLLANQTHKGRLWLVGIQHPGKQARLTWSFILNYDSGSNWSASSMAPIDSAVVPDLYTPYPDLWTNTPASYTQFYGGRGQYSWDDTYSVDMKVSWAVPIGIWKAQIIGDVFVQNLFNTQMTSGFNNTFRGGTPQTQLRIDSPTNFGRQQLHTGANDWQFLNGRRVQCSLGLRF